MLKERKKIKKKIVTIEVLVVGFDKTRIDL